MFHSIPIFYNEKVCEVRIGAVRRYYRLHAESRMDGLALFGIPHTLDGEFAQVPHRFR